MRESEKLSMYLIRRKLYYYIRYFDESENRLKQFPTKCKTKSDALEFLSNFKEKIKQRKKLKFITLDSFRKEYLDYVEILHSPKYHSSIRKTFKNLIEVLGNIPLIKIDQSTLEKFLFDTFKRAKYNAWHHYRNLKAAFNYAISKNYIEINPAQKVKLPRLPEKINLYISENEFEQIIEKTEKQVFKTKKKGGYHYAF